MISNENEKHIINSRVDRRYDKIDQKDNSITVKVPLDMQFTTSTLDVRHDEQLDSNDFLFTKESKIDRANVKEKKHVSARELAATFNTLLDAIESRLDRSKALEACDLVFDLRRLLEK